MVKCFIQGWYYLLNNTIHAFSTSWHHLWKVAKKSWDLVKFTKKGGGGINKMIFFLERKNCDKLLGGGLLTMYICHKFQIT